MVLPSETIRSELCGFHVSNLNKLRRMMGVYQTFLLPVSLFLPLSTSLIVFFSGQKAEMWNGLRVSYIQFHYLSLASPSLGEHHLSPSVTPIWVEHAEVSHCQPATPQPLHPTLPLSSLCCPSLSLHSSKQGQLRTELAPCLHLKPPPITALWHPHQHKHVVSPSPFPSLSLRYPPGEREGGVF